MLFNYNRRNIVLITLLITIVMFFSINKLIIQYVENTRKCGRKAGIFRKSSAFLQ